MLNKLDILATVDELTRGEVVRMAIREYFDDIDWKATIRDYEKLVEEEDAETETEEDVESEKSEDDRDGDDDED